MSMENIASSVLGKIVDCLFDAAGRQLGYLLHYNDNIKTLKKQIKKLADMRDRVQGKIDVANRNGEIIEADVLTWVAEVDRITAKAEKFLDDEVKANKRCLKGWCINLRSCYRFSKEAKQRNEAIDQLQKESNFEKVSRAAPPPEIIYSSKGFSVPSNSRELIKKKIMEALKNDSVSIIGICGMGGVGKTTLVKEISKKAKEDKLYDAVAMAVVSQNPSITRIQEEISSQLGRELSGDNQLIRAGYLRQRITKEKRILVVLDDVWGRIELDEIGIPFGDDHKGCKVMLTSRSQLVCNQMDAQQVFIVETLSKQESWILFKEVAGQVVDDNSINPIAREVAAKCGGLPIAILTVGRALKSKNKNVWTDAAQQLKKSITTNIEGMHKNVFSNLELSYNYLESEEAKSLFLFCSFFPEDSFIQMEELIRYGIGLRWFKEVDTVEDARVRVHTVVSTLVSFFLLIDENGLIKMHDVVRDFALMIAPKYNHIFMVKAGVGLRQWPSRDSYQDLTGISLMRNHILEAPDGLKCPKLQILLLQNNSEFIVQNDLVQGERDVKFPDSFFQEMKDLKVLDLSYIRLLSLPSSLSLLTSLTTLCLSNYWLVDVSIIGKLINLEILDLSGSSISEIPKDFCQLTHLKLLDLSWCTKLTLIPNGVMPCLNKLEELNMTGSFMQWDYEREGDSGSNARLVELQALSRLTSLQIRIPGGIVLPSDMSFQNLTSFAIAIGFTYGDPNSSLSIHGYSRNLMLTNDMRVSIQFDWIKNLLKRTENLILSNVIDSENFLCNQLILNNGFNELKSLSLGGCLDVKYLLNTLEWTTQVTFENLEVLMLDCNPNLVEICHGQLPLECFSKLKDLVVRMCWNMSIIVPSHLLQRLQNLKKVAAWSCQSLVFVFDFEGLEIVNEETKLLTSLQELSLWYLPNMTHIWKGDTQWLSLCNLQRVDMGYCQKLIVLFPPPLLQSLTCLEDLRIRYSDDLEEVFGKTKSEERQDNEIVLWKKDHTIASPSLGKLSYVNIHDCNKLKNVFTPSIAKSLVLLEILMVSYCSSMEEIVIDDDEGPSTERIVFPTLKYLRLKFLDNLTCFCAGLCAIEFPALENLKIVECPKMKTFGYGDQVTPKLNKVKLENGQCWMGNLNDTVQKLFNEQAMVQKQEDVVQQEALHGNTTFES